MLLKLGHFREWIRNTWAVLECGAGEGWRSSVGQTMEEMKKYYKTSRRKGISCIRKEGRLTRLVTSCVGTAI
jgi:hypothetical protein